MDDMIDFNGLVSLMLEETQLDASIDLLILLDFGKTNIQTVFQIKQGKAVSWYLTLAKDENYKP